jgi:protein-L-isoaspartate(D-aspartate) O-methyltransferase
MTFDFAAARLNMVESQVRTADVTDPKIPEAMRIVDREKLCLPDRAFLAYADVEARYAPGRWMMRPRDAGKILMSLNARPGERALAIAAPYLAAILEQMGLSVERADGDDLTQVPPGPFDVVVCEGAVGQAPQAWLDVLDERGRLAVVERRGPVGKARLYMRSENGISSREVFDSAAVLLPQFEPKASFAF